jgi:hypothetical protein
MDIKEKITDQLVEGGIIQTLRIIESPEAPRGNVTYQIYKPILDSEYNDLMKSWEYYRTHPEHHFCENLIREEFNRVRVWLEIVTGYYVLSLDAYSDWDEEEANESKMEAVRLMEKVYHLHEFFGWLIQNIEFDVECNIEEEVFASPTIH